MPRRSLPAAAGILLLLALPAIGSAHEITDVDIDCEAQAIEITGVLFGQEGGATVTVTGPDGYIQSFFADQDAEWTVVLPLGADGTYVIDWPNSGDNGPVEFVVDCAEGEVLPTEEAATPTPTPDGAVLPTQEAASPTPEGAVLSDVESAAGPTLPPTDTAAGASGGVNGASLGFLALAAIAAWITLAIVDRGARGRERNH